MTDDMIELARRAVACKGWQWMPGMLAGDGFRCVWADEISREWASPVWAENGMNWKNKRTGSKDLPDLTDPATLGCLLTLVRAAHGAPSVTFEGRTYPSVLHVVCSSGIYHVKRDCGDGDEDLYEDGVWSQNYRRDAYSIVRTSEAEALVAALEVAPDRGEHRREEER